MDRGQPERTSGRRLGIGGKLLAAFGAIAALTVAATVIAWVLFANVRENLAIIAEDSLPEIAASFGIAEESAQISAVIPRLVAAGSASELATMRAEVRERLAEITELAHAHAGHEQDSEVLVEALDEAVHALGARIEQLERAVQRSLAARQQREFLLDSLASDHIVFVDTVAPIIDDARDGMVASTRQSVADGTARIAGLVDESFEALRGVMQIQANINLITAILHQVAATGDERVLRDRRFAIVGPIADIRTQLTQVSGVEDGALFVDLTERILGFAVGEHSIFALRRATLGDDPAAAEAARRRLAVAIDELDTSHARFLELNRGMVDLVDERTLEAAANASKESQAIVRITEKGILRLERLLFIHSDVNQLFGLLGEAGTAIYSEDIESFRIRFDLLRERLEQHLREYEAGEHDPAVRRTAVQVLSYGQGDRSVLTSRLEELEAEENAAAMLAESQRLAAELGRSAQGLVKEAETAGADAESRTIAALATGEYVLVAIAVASLAAALLIAWLYVYRRIVRRLTSLSDSMLAIADGDLETEIVFQGGNDEITDMRGALVVFRDDAHKRRQAEQAVRESEQRMRLILATSPIGVGISRLEDGTIVYANRRLAEQLGRRTDELVGMRAADLYANQDIRERLLERVDRDGRVTDAEVLLKKADGSEFWTLLSFFPIEYAGGPARLGWIYDIAERKRAEEELREAKEAAETALADLEAAQARLVQTEKMASLGQLTAGVAHEIKNPLNFVKNFAEVSSELLDELEERLRPALEGLEEDARDDARHQLATIEGMLGKIREHGGRADSIVQSMLSHTREGPATTQPTDLNALLNESLDLAYHAARAEDQSFNVTLERAFDDAVGELDLYPADLMRAFLNLIGNAFYATRKRAVESDDNGYAPTVSVSTRSTDATVDIRIRDNGTGIPETVRERIFDPFFTTKPPGEGTGLGLSLSYETVVQQHGGWMEVSSREGEFTEFLVTLPRQPGLKDNRGEAL